jgi:hypothetical protein
LPYIWSRNTAESSVWCNATHLLWCQTSSHPVFTLKHDIVGLIQPMLINKTFGNAPDRSSIWGWFTRMQLESMYDLDLEPLMLRRNSILVPKSKP